MPSLCLVPLRQDPSKPMTDNILLPKQEFPSIHCETFVGVFDWGEVFRWVKRADQSKGLD